MGNTLPAETQSGQPPHSHLHGRLEVADAEFAGASQQVGGVAVDSL
jgi:hypothetical protein